MPSLIMSPTAISNIQKEFFSVQTLELVGNDVPTKDRIYVYISIMIM